MPLGYDYIINCLMIMSMIGLSVKIFFGSEKSPNGDYGSASSTIWGFGLVSLSIVTLMFVSYSLHAKFNEIKNKNKNKNDPIKIGIFLMEFMSQSVPSILTVIILLWVITLNITFYKRINQGNVANEYFSLTSGSSFLFTFQVICLFLYLTEYIKGQSNNPSLDQLTNDNSSLNRIKFAIYFIALINLMITGMMTIILYLFSTDG